MSAVRLRHLAPATVLLVAEALVVAVAIELALSLMPFARLLDGLQRLDRLAFRRTGAADAARLRRVAVAVHRLLPVRVTCLRQSLVLLALMRRRGQPASLRIGVRKNGDAIAAHAWIESVGTAAAGDAGEFFPLGPIPTAARGL